MVVPLEFNEISGGSKKAVVTLPNNDTWSRIEIAVPDGVPRNAEISQGWPYEITSYGIAITPSTALSDLFVGADIYVDNGTAVFYAVEITFE